MHDRNRGKNAEHETLLHRRSRGGGGGARSTMYKKGLHGDVMRSQMMAGDDEWNVKRKCGS